MALDKNKKENILRVIALLNRPEYKDKQEIGQKINRIEISDKERAEIDRAFKDIDRNDWNEFLDTVKDDKELLKDLADMTLSYLAKQSPELMRELKEKYFKNT